MKLVMQQQIQRISQVKNSILKQIIQKKIKENREMLKKQAEE